jgi:hypothetical protein
LFYSLIDDDTSDIVRIEQDKLRNGLPSNSINGFVLSAGGSLNTNHPLANDFPCLIIPARPESSLNHTVEYRYPSRLYEYGGKFIPACLLDKVLPPGARRRMQAIGFDPRADGRSR